MPLVPACATREADLLLKLNKLFYFNHAGSDLKSDQDPLLFSSHVRAHRKTRPRTARLAPAPTSLQSTLPC